MSNGYTYTTSTGGGPITFVQVKAATPSAPSASVSVTYPLAQTAGNLNLVAVGWNDTTSTVTRSATLAETPTRWRWARLPAQGMRQSIYYARNIAGGSNTVTVTFNQAAAFVDVRVLEYSGLDTANPLDRGHGSGRHRDPGEQRCGEHHVGQRVDLRRGHDARPTSRAPAVGFVSRIITNPDADIAEDLLVSSTGSYSATAPAYFLRVGDAGGCVPGQRTGFGQSGADGEFDLAHFRNHGGRDRSQHHRHRIPGGSDGQIGRHVRHRRDCR